MEDNVNVVIADDHRLYREAIGSILSSEETIRIIGEVSTGFQAVITINELKPDVALLGINMNNINDLDFISPLREKSPDTKPLLLSNTLNDTMIFRALEAGIRGYISKNTSSPDLVKAIHTVHRGELWAERKLIAKYFEEESLAESNRGNGDLGIEEDLSAREIEVLKVLTTGCTNKEIAQALFISEKTVKSHLNRIFRKLKVTRRLEATLCAIKKGLC